MTSSQTNGRPALAERKANSTYIPPPNMKETYIPPPALPAGPSTFRGPATSNENVAPVHPGEKTKAPTAIATSTSKKRKSDGTEAGGAPATKKRVPAAAKKTKGDSSTLDVSAVTSLPDAPKKDGRIPVYDTCNEVRRKIRALLKKPDVTQAALLRALKAENPEGKTVSVTSFQTFMNKTRPLATAGNTSIVFYTAYVLFEKMRVRDNKPKTQHRETMERLWAKESGVPLDHKLDGFWTCRAGERPQIDEFGRVHFH